MKKLITALLVSVSVSVNAFQPADSLVQKRLAEMKVVKEVWQSTQLSDTFVCKTYCKTFAGRPAYLHTGNFPPGSEFHFMEAQPFDVLGPYIDGNCMSLYKFVGRQARADSARISQILVSYYGAKGAEPYVKRSREQARARADSLCYELRVGRIFMDEIMVMESDDVSGLIYNGGDYGWITNRSEQPLEVIDAVFNNRQGSFGVVESEKGFHVISIDSVTHVWETYVAWEILWCIDSCYDLKGKQVSTEACYPGGFDAMMQFLMSEKAKYDSLDVAGQFDYPILVFFDILPDGTTANVAVLQQYWITPGIVIDITKLFRSMPKWKPAQTCEGPVAEEQVVVIYL